MVSELKPSPENDEIYKPLDGRDPELQRLAASIKSRGLLEPLTITTDRFIVSGHRRWAACRLAGIERVDCRVLEISRADNRAGFLKLLREHNRQRTKTVDEVYREEIIDLDPAKCHDELRASRIAASKVSPAPIELDGWRGRKEISPAKQPMLDAAIAALKAREKYLPISLRSLHYALVSLAEPPLRHSKKRGSTYRNDRRSYQDLSDLVTRARIAGIIEPDSLCDETRPIETWHVHSDTRSFIREECDNFLTGYYRDLLQSQPHHIELLVEKNSVRSIAAEVAEEYCVPLTSGRGYASFPPRWTMAQRYLRSGKDKLILLVASDFDPDGESICESFARSMRDDFNIHKIHAIKVALTAKQVLAMQLPGAMDAKHGSSQYKKFVALHGTDCFELEALQPDQLQTILRDGIEAVLDHRFFNQELAAEQADAVQLAALRKAALIAAGLTTSNRKK